MGRLRELLDELAMRKDDARRDATQRAAEADVRARDDWRNEGGHAEAADRAASEPVDASR